MIDFYYIPLIAVLVTAYSIVRTKKIKQLVTLILTPLLLVYLYGIADGFFDYDVILYISASVIVICKFGRYVLFIMLVFNFLLSGAQYKLEIYFFDIDSWFLSFISLCQFCILMIGLFSIFVKYIIRRIRYHKITATYQGFEKHNFYYYHIFTYEIDGVMYNNNASTVEYFKWEERFSRVKCEVSQERVIYVNPKKHEKFIV